MTLARLVNWRASHSIQMCKRVRNHNSCLLCLASAVATHGNYQQAVRMSAPSGGCSLERWPPQSIWLRKQQARLRQVAGTSHVIWSPNDHWQTQWMIINSATYRHHDRERWERSRATVLSQSTGCDNSLCPCEHRVEHCLWWLFALLLSHGGVYTRSIACPMRPWPQSISITVLTSSGGIPTHSHRARVRLDKARILLNIEDTMRQLTELQFPWWHNLCIPSPSRNGTVMNAPHSVPNCNGQSSSSL